MVSTVDVAGRFCRKPERRSVAPHARRRVGQGTTQLAEYENHAYTMSDVTTIDGQIETCQGDTYRQPPMRRGGWEETCGHWPSSRTR